jgi:hypothetical protein
MKKIIPSLLIYFLLNINTILSAEISATLIARHNDAQIPSLKNWFNQTLPGINLAVLDFEQKEAKWFLLDLNLEFIPAVIFDGPLSPEDTSLLKEKFNITSVKHYGVIPRDILERIFVLELYTRRSIARQLDLFVMSLCPYALEAEKSLLDYLKRYKPDVRLRLRYLVEVKGKQISSRHGERELREDKRQVIIQKYWPKIFFDYLLLRQKKSYNKTLAELKIDPLEIKKKLPKAEKILLKDYALSRKLKIYASPTLLWENKYLIPSLDQLGMRLASAQKSRPSRLPASHSGPLRIEMFFSPRCHACHEIKDNFLPRIMDKYKDKIEVVYYSIDEPQNYNALLELEDKFGILEHGTIPKIFLADYALIGANQIQARLENIIQEYLAQEKITPAEEQVKFMEKQIPPRLLELFKTFTAGTICWAGLIDGINPCAFTTLIFFLSFLSFAEYKRRQIFYLGTFFIISVFFTYFLLGLGVFKFILKLKIYATIAEVFYYAVGVLVLILGLVSFYDFFRFAKTKKIEDVKLKLPQSVKWRIQSVIGKGYRREGKAEKNQARPIKLIFLSLVIGFIVSILESVCTGQVYLPTITFITKVPELKIKAVFYLFLYNLMFIIPLLIIFVLALFGLTSERFARFSQRHLAKIKLATAMFFFSLFFLLWKLR